MDWDEEYTSGLGNYTVLSSNTMNMSQGGALSIKDSLFFDLLLAGVARNYTTTEPLALATEPPVFAMPQLTYIYVLVTIFYVIFFILGVVGNVLVPVVVITNEEMRTPTNWFLVNLSITDLLVILVCIPAALLEFHAKDVWVLGPIMCKLVPYLENLVAFASVLVILVVSFERYYAICRPLQVLYTCTTSRAIKIICCIWVVAMLSALPFMVFSFLEEATFHDGSDVVVCRTPIDNVYKKGYVLTTLVVFFVVPLFTVTCLYYSICRALQADTKQATIQMLSSREREGSHEHARRQVVILLTVIIFVFFVCLLPIRVVTIWYIYSSIEEKTALGLEGYLNVISFARTMMYANSAVNPIIYNIVSAKFRLAFLRALGKRPTVVEVRRLSVTTSLSNRSRSSKFDENGLTFLPKPTKARYSESDIGYEVTRIRSKPKSHSVPECAWPSRPNRVFEAEEESLTNLENLMTESTQV